MIFPYNPQSFTPNLPQLPNQLVQGLKDVGAAYATNWKNNTVHNQESFNWIPSDKLKDEVVPTHGNFAGPGYGAGKRNPTEEEVKNGLESMVKDPVTGVSRKDEVDVIAKPHDIAYGKAEKIKETNFAEYMKQIIAADQALIDGTRAMLDKDSRGEIHLTDGERDYGKAMLALFELKQFYQKDIKNAIEQAKLEAQMAKMLLDAAWKEIRPYQQPVDNHDTRNCHPNSNNPKTDPINKWREDNWKPNDNPRPPTDDTYRIVYIGDPLALDLDGDGVETVATSAGVTFDHNADGIATNSGWIKADDGLLVRDINGNGTIDTGRELFGDNTKLSSGNNAANGFAALADLDANADGKIDSSDAAFVELKIWRDLNQDGVSQTNELSTLADLGIQSLDTTGTRVSVPVPGGSQILTGSYTKADGTTATLADLNLTQDTFYSQYTDTVEIPAELAELPTIAGMGRLRNLREAAALSPALAAVLTQYAAADTREEQRPLIDQLLLEWAKTDPLYTEAPVKILFTDVMQDELRYDENSSNIIYLRAGQQPGGANGSNIAANPNADTELQHRTRIIDAVLGDRVTTRLDVFVTHEAAKINYTYASLADTVYADLLTQTRFKKYLNAVELSITETSISLDTSKVTQMFQERIASDPKGGLTDLIEFNKYANDLLNGTQWDGLALLDESLRGQPVTPELQSFYQEFNILFDGANGGATDDIILGDDQIRTINAGEGNNILLGGTADETLTSGIGSDLIRGGDGNDTIIAGLGDDVIDGGHGDDTLYGTGGNGFYSLTDDNDTYLFGWGDGHDTINNRNSGMKSNDAIRFKEGISSSDVRFERIAGYSEDMRIILGDGTDSITVKNWFSSPNYRIARFEFSDGTVLDSVFVDSQLTLEGTAGNDILKGSYCGETINGNAGDDTINASSGDDLIFGGAGNDTIFGEDGSDRLDGGVGDDLLVGGYGNDTYLFGRGDGHDTANEGFGSGYYLIKSPNDAIEFKPDVLPDDVIVRRSGNDMILSLKGTDDRLTIKGTFNEYSETNRIEQVRFADGTAWDFVAMLALALHGSDGEDVLEGTSGNDVLDGGAGNDLLKGGNGADTYRFGHGYGNDIIEEGYWGGVDTVEFQAGITPNDLTFTVDASGSLLIGVKESGDSLLIKSGAASIERYLFSDGTILTPDEINSLASILPSDESIVGTDGDDNLVGSDLDSMILGLNGNDTLAGSGGNDSLFGGDGDDVLIGGAGRDYLGDGNGANIYRFERGTGLDRLQTRLMDGTDDTVEFGAGITSADIQVQLGDPYNSGFFTLVIGIGNNDAFEITVDGGYDVAQSSLRHFRFSDGTEMSLEQILALKDDGLAGYQYGNNLIGSNSDDTIYGDYFSGNQLRGRDNNDYISGGYSNDVLAGDNGDDTLNGSGGSDILAGGAGNDQLSGGEGNDTYLFNLGDGNDRIETSGSSNDKDTLSFGSGISSQDVSAFVNESGELVLQVDGGNGGSIVCPWFNANMQENQSLPLSRVQFVTADGDVRIFDLTGLMRANAGALANSDKDRPVALFNNADGFDITTSTLPAGGDIAVAYAENGDPFTTPSYAHLNSGSDGNDIVQGTPWNDNLNSGAGNDLIHGFDGDDYLDGGAGNDRVDAGAGNDIIYGGSGDDAIFAGDGDDMIYAGPGNDIAYGGNGNDTYLFNAGDGRLSIEDSYLDSVTDGYGGGIAMSLALLSSDGGYGGGYGGTITTTNVLRFGAGIAFSGLKFSEQGGYLVIDIPATGDQLRLAGYNPDRPTLTNAVDSYIFADGSVASPSDILSAGISSAGTGGDDYFNGTIGSDIIEGGSGNDEFTTGRGDDHLSGGGGDDTYVFNLGDGVDTIEDISDPGMENRVNFGYGISPDSIKTEVVDGDLILWVGDGGDGIRFEGFDPTIPGMPQPVERFNFWDGSSMSFSDLLDSKAGAAYQVGGSGSNTYVFNQGDGVVSIFDFPEEGAANVLKFGPGIAPEELLRHLRFESSEDSGSGSGTFIIAFDNGDQVRMDGFTPEDVDNSPRSIDTFVFDDGTILSFAEAARSIFVVEGAELSDSLTGTNLSDRLYGYEESDFLESGAGNDALTGGIDDDFLSGGSGRDTYIFNLGDGIDTIIDAAQNGVGNIASFGPGITRDDLVFTQDGTTLTISYGAQGDAIIVENFDPTGVNGTLVIDTFEFSDGNVLSYRELTNHAPVVAEPLTNLTVVENQAFVFQVPDGAFSDADNDQMSYTVSVSDQDALPGWLHYDPATRTISGTPGNSDVGPFTVTVSAIDPLGTTASQSFILTVENVNDAPIEVLPLSAQAAIQDQLFSFQVPEGSFKDIDTGDQLAYSATLANGDHLPGWLQFDAISGTFSGTPGNDNVGGIGVRVIATDLSGTMAESVFTLTVQNVNDAPVATIPIPDLNATAGAAFSWQVPVNTFTDVDAGDSISFGATLSNGDPLPAWLTFDPASQTFSGTPTSGSTGSAGIQLTATDRAGATANSSFNLTVTGGNSGPVAVPDTASVIEDRHIWARGNVLANDSDPDPGAVLKVTSPGIKQGDYGYLGIIEDGKYYYQLAGNAASVQSLGRDDTVTDRFDYTVTDGTSAASSTLVVSISGTNDAPIVIKRLADRGLTSSKNFSFRLPENSFTDVDKGDVLTYTATLANGSALPDWLKFDAASGTFSGKAPKTVRDLDIRVTATDKVSASGNTDGSLSVSDTFSLSIVKGDSWVREEDDEPSHEECDDGNDSVPTEPHFPGRQDRHEEEGDRRKAADQSSKNDDHRQQPDFEQLSTSPAPYLNSEQLDRHLHRFDHMTVSLDDQSIAARWQAIDRAISLDLANSDDCYQNLKLGADLSHLGSNGEGMTGGNGYGMGNMAIAAGSGTNLKGFNGLKEGLHSL